MTTTAPETISEQVSRVYMMAEGGETWDLSDYDIAALKAVLAQRARLRAALVGLVGVDTREDLEAMEAVIRITPAPAEDKAATIDAIHALLATVK